MNGSENGKFDKHGKTEEQFLREYDVTKYFRPSVTTDAVLFCPSAHGGKVLLIRRGGHPFLGQWAFPGGFVEENEPCEVAAPRELMEETGITDVPLRQLMTASTPGRDPRWRNITVVYTATLDKPIAAKGGDDAAEAEWFDVEANITEKAATLTLTPCTENKGEKPFTAELKLARDAFGKIDINKTEIVSRGLLAFDHAKILCYLIEECK